MIVELSTGHVFERGSVKGIGPLNREMGFEVIGVGFREKIYCPVLTIPYYEPQRKPGEDILIYLERRNQMDKKMTEEAAKALRQEFIDKLLK